MLTNTETRDLNLKLSWRVLHYKFIIFQDCVCSSFLPFLFLIDYLLLEVGCLLVLLLSLSSISVLLLDGARLIMGRWVAHGLTTSGHGRRISARDGATGSGSVGRGGRSGCLLLEHGPIKRIVVLMIESAEKDAEQLPQVHVVGSLLKPKSSGKDEMHDKALFF